MPQLYITIVLNESLCRVNFIIPELGWRKSCFGTLRSQQLDQHFLLMGLNMF